jgi:DNA gyrase inhibitor GyrI/DNA-binding HxlR family transcriptional regulator
MDLFLKATGDDFVWKTITKFDGDIALVLGSLANKRRLHLLASLLVRSRTFNELKGITGLGKTALAHHLGILVENGVLKRIGRGRYELSPDGAELLNAICSAYTKSRRRRKLEAARRADYIQKIYTKQKELDMKEFKVRIVRLEPMRVASVRVISETPERDAWAKMRTWAQPKGLLDDLEKHPVFGFNNPNPSPDHKEYGYEFWIRVEPEIKHEGEIKIKEFKGGLYAVTTCNLKEEIESEFFQKKGYLESWKKIVDWVKSSKYNFGKHQALEKAHDPEASDEEFVLDLYCPIEE